jgi:hypothetical protein
VVDLTNASIENVTLFPNCVISENACDFNVISQWFFTMSKSNSDVGHCFATESHRNDTSKKQPLPHTVQTRFKNCLALEIHLNHHPLIRQRLVHMQHNEDKHYDQSDHFVVLNLMDMFRPDSCGIYAHVA